MTTLFKRLALFCVLGLTIVACSSTQEEESPNDQPFPFARLAPSAPPPAPYEEKLSPDEPLRQIWRKGYWDYDGTQFFWVPGQFMYRPDPTAAWTPDRWERRAFGWAFVPGYWQ